jgi:hypothetical protein
MPGSPYAYMYKHANLDSHDTIKLKYATLYTPAGNNQEAQVYGSGSIAQLAIIPPLVQSGTTYSYYYTSARYITLRNCNITNTDTSVEKSINGLEIVGIGGTPKFKYPDSTHVGWTDTLGLPTPPINGLGDDRILNSQKDLFRFENVDNIAMSNLEIDGNNVQSFVMGVRSAGLQEGAHGINLIDCKRLSVSNIHVHHMQLDGIGINDMRCYQPTYARFDSIRSEYNGRQAFTWTEGDSIIFSHCSFNHTATAASQVQPGGVFGMTPAAGIDIEFESTCPDLTKQYVCINGYFSDCEFVDNAGSAVANYYPNGSVIRTNNMNFKHCTFVDGDNNLYGIQAEGAGFTFDSCNIYCSIYNAYDGAFASNANTLATRFLNCTFEDKPYNGQHWLPSLRMFYLYYAKRTLFQNCTFKLTDPSRSLGELTFQNLSEEDMLVVDNCKFIFANAGASPSFTPHFRNFKFRNHNSFTNTINAPSNYQAVRFDHTIIENSSDICRPSSLTFDGQIMVQLTQYGADSLCVGYPHKGSSGGATLLLKNKALLADMYNNYTICVDSLSSIDIMPTAGMYNHMYIYNKGKVACHEGSSVDGNYAVIVNQGNNASVFVSKDVNPGGNIVSPFWANAAALGAYLPWQPTVSTCVQGGNPAYVNACSPIFTNYHSGGALSILYNLSTPTCSTSANDSITFAISGGTAPYTTSLDYGPATSNTYFANLAGGSHTLVVSDAAGCTDTMNFLSTGALPAAFCCNTNFITGNNPLYLDNKVASYLNASTITNQSFFINGTLTIDQNFSFTNCHFYFTVSASIQLLNSATLTLNNCTLQAGCGAMWDGIYADDVSEQLSITDCAISDMEHGIVASNSAPLKLAHNNFTNNHTSVVLYKAAAPYNTAQGNCIITNNTFGSTGIALLPPYQGQSKGELGINIVQCEEAQVGSIDALLPLYTDRNTFDNLYCGINVWHSADASLAQHAILLNNYFSNINADGDATDKFKKLYTQHRGAAIAGWEIAAGNSPFSLTTNHRITVNNVYTSNQDNFLNCDKGILTSRLSAEVHNCNMYNTPFGLLHMQCDGKEIVLGDKQDDGITEGGNKLIDMHYGIVVQGNPALAEINENNITTRSAFIQVNMPLNSYSGQRVYPRGIQYLGFSTTAQAVRMRQNTIGLNSKLGVGIAAYNMGEAGLIDRNNILLSNATAPLGAVSLPTSEYGLFGISTHTCTKSGIVGNTVTGSQITVISDAIDRLVAGINIGSSPQQHYECNHVQHSTLGWWVEGDCGTQQSALPNNDWNHHWWGILYTPLTIDGTLGDMGEPGTNYNFAFNGNYDSDPNQLTADRLFRITGDSNGASIPKIFTTSITQNQSGATVPGFAYRVYSAVNPILPCTGTYTVQGGDVGDGTSWADADVAAALDVVNDSLPYYGNTNIAAWISELQLYAQLDADSNLRNSNSSIASFYDAKHLAAMGAIHKVNAGIADMMSLSADASAAQQQELYDDLVNINASVADAFTPEANEKFVNTVYLRYLHYGTDSISTADSAQLSLLAKSCPLEAGTAVYKARSIYSHYEPYLVYNNLQLCGTSPSSNARSAGGGGLSLANIWQQLQSSNIQATLSTLANSSSHAVQQPLVQGNYEEVQQLSQHLAGGAWCAIAPNPANAVITVQLSAAITGTAALAIHNTTGALVHKASINTATGSTHTLDISSLAPGTYFCELSTAAGFTFTSKLTVIR